MRLGAGPDGDCAGCSRRAILSVGSRRDDRRSLASRDLRTPIKAASALTPTSFGPCIRTPARSGAQTMGSRCFPRPPPVSRAVGPDNAMESPSAGVPGNGIDRTDWNSPEPTHRGARTLDGNAPNRAGSSARWSATNDRELDVGGSSQGNSLAAGPVVTEQPKCCYPEKRRRPRCDGCQHSSRRC